MLTLKEVMDLLINHYSVEDAVEIINPKIEDLVYSLEDVISENFDSVLEQLEEDML